MGSESSKPCSDSDGRIIFCSGLDRSVWELYAGRERELHFGGGLVRQVRVDTNGDIFWSGLETPIDNNPLPDGFLYRMRHGTNNVETLLTFSQDLVGRDWWGAFDVRQGEVFVATRSLPTRIYRLVNSIPELVVTLPTELASFRIIDGQQFLVSNGNDRLLRFRDIASPQTSELVVQTPGRFVDFTVRAINGKSRPATSSDLSHLGIESLLLTKISGRYR